MEENVNKMVKMALLTAFSVVMMLLIRFPLIPSAPFLEYEPADVPVLVGGFLYGPMSGLLMVVVVSIIQAVTVSAGSGWIGAIMHVVASGALVVVSALIYKKVHTMKGAIIGLVAGTISMTLLMIPLNLFFTTKFLGVPMDVVKAMLIPAIIPFNLLKGSINSIIVFAVYKSVGRLLRAEGMLGSRKDIENNRTI